MIWTLRIVGVIASAILMGFVTKALWKWFAVPLGVPPISLLHALGLSLLWTCFAGISKRTTPWECENEAELWIKAFATPLWLFVFGYLFQLGVNP